MTDSNKLDLPWTPEEATAWVLCNGNTYDFGMMEYHRTGKLSNFKDDLAQVCTWVNAVAATYPEHVIIEPEMEDGVGFDVTVFGIDITYQFGMDDISTAIHSVLINKEA